MSYKFYLNNIEDSDYFYDRVVEIAKEYGTPRSTVKPKNTPEPLNITILMDPSKDPYTTVREVIRQANEIKDRPVFITIS